MGRRVGGKEGAEHSAGGAEDHVGYSGLQHGVSWVEGGRRGGSIGREGETDE